MNTVSPVTEDEVNAFFRRLATMIVDQSAQGKQIANLQTEVGHLNERLARVTEDSERVRRELAETWSLMSTVEKERDEAKASVERLQQDLTQTNERHAADRRDYEDRLSAAHDAMAGRDSRIADLESRLYEAQAESEGRRQEVERFERHVQQITGTIDYWRDKALRIEQELAETVAKARSLFGVKPEPKQVEVQEPPKQIEHSRYTEERDEIPF